MRIEHYNPRDLRRLSNEVSPFSLSAQVQRAGAAVGNRLQFFLANPNHSPYSYYMTAINLRVAVNVATQNPLFFTGSGDLGPADDAAFVTTPGSIMPHDTGYVGSPRLGAFATEVIGPATIRTGSRSLNWRGSGTIFAGSVNPYVTTVLIRPGTWWSWSPLQGAGECWFEAALLELRDDERAEYRARNLDD